MFVLPIRVYYEDTDAGGVVYHSQYLNFMERARTEWLRHLGFEQTDLRLQDRVLFVVHSMQCYFKKPARFNDLCEVRCSLLELGRSSFSCLQQIWCGQTLLFEAQVKIACVNADSFKPAGMPARVRTAMEST